MLQNAISQMSAATNPLSALLDAQSGSAGVGFTIPFFVRRDGRDD